MEYLENMKQTWREFFCVSSPSLSPFCNLLFELCIFPSVLKYFIFSLLFAALVVPPYL